MIPAVPILRKAFHLARNGLLLVAGTRSLRCLLSCRCAGVVEIGVKSHLTNFKSSGKFMAGEGCRVHGVTSSGIVSLGRYTSLNGPNITLFSKIYPIQIGSFCSIARNVQIQEYNHDMSKPSTYFMSANVFGGGIVDDVVSKGPIRIGDDVWIGANAVILSGVSIGTGAIVAAGAIVVADVPEFAVVGGTPAKVISMRFSETQIRRLKQLDWYRWSIAEIIANREFFSSPLPR